jgi:hypothetical protein
MYNNVKVGKTYLHREKLLAVKCVAVENNVATLEYSWESEGKPRGYRFQMTTFNFNSYYEGWKPVHKKPSAKYV